MKIIWSGSATGELDDIVRYIARDSVASALQVQDRILSASYRLAELPLRGRPGRLGGARELVVARTSCLIVYLVSDDRIDILRILHRARQRPPE